MNFTKRLFFFLRLSSSLCVLLAATSSAFGGGTVTNLTQGDLQAALAGGGTVLFAVNGTLPLTNSIIIAQNTLMDANGHNVTISGGNSVRLFIVTTNVGFQINGLTLADGRVVGTNGLDFTSTPGTSGQSVFGGGIWNQGGTLALYDCIMTNHCAIGGNSGTNHSTLPYGVGWPTMMYGGDASGGCIYSIGGTVNLTNCTLSGNSAVGGFASSAPWYPAASSGGAFGGALYLQGTGHMQNVTFLNDRATAGAIQAKSSYDAAGAGGPGLGGAVFATNSMVLIDASSAVSNSATGGGVMDDSYRDSYGLGSGRAMGGVLFFSRDSSASIEQLSALGNSVAGGNGDRYQPGGDGMGGVIFNAGTLEVSNCTFSLSHSRGGGGSIFPGAGLGGAICSTNIVRINACTFDHDSAVGASASLETTSPWNGAQGAGGAVWSSGVLAMTNCTCTANSAQGGVSGGALTTGGGGDGCGGAVAITNGAAYLVNVTIAQNRADGGGGNPFGPSQGGEIYNTNGTVTCQNSIFANSPHGGEVWGTLVDLGYNICSDGTANFSAGGSLNNTDPVLGPLANNGGPTATMALLVGSPALNVIPSGYPPVDQRGVSRPQGSAADIGAFETATGVILPPALVSSYDGANIAISFSAQGGVSYRLLHATDMHTWSSVATNYAYFTGWMQFTQPVGPGPVGYYRVVTP